MQHLTKLTAMLSFLGLMVSCQPQAALIPIATNPNLPTSYIEDAPIDQWVVRININDLQNLADTSTPFLLYLGNPTCSSCLRFQPIFTQWIEDTETLVYYLDTLQLLNQLSNLQSTFPQYFPEGFSTPSLYLLQGNERLHRIGASDAFFSLPRFSALMRSYVTKQNSES